MVLDLPGLDRPPVAVDPIEECPVRIPPTTVCRVALISR
jgi:hypothetical protein